MNERNSVWYDIESNKYLKDATTQEIGEYLEDVVVDIVDNETPHAEEGESDPIRYFRYEGKFYEVKVEIFWNRYDKQFYYIDGTELTSCKEVTALEVLTGESV